MSAVPRAWPEPMSLDEAVARILARVRAGARPCRANPDLRCAWPDPGRRCPLAARRPARRQQRDGRLRAARRRRSGQPAAVLPVSQRIAAGSVGSSARAWNGGADLHRRARSRPRRRCRRHAGAVRPRPTAGVRIDVVHRQLGNSIRRAWRRRRPRRGSFSPRGSALSPQALGLAASVGAERRSAVGAPARVALFFDRRRAGDARRGRCSSTGRDLQLEPLHPARPASNRSAGLP